MGRVLSIDRVGARLALSDPATLSPWLVGDQASFTVSFDGEPVGRFTERVLARDDESVTLEVTLEVALESTEIHRFVVRTPDSWPSRGNWMLTRPVLEAWTVDDSGERTPLPDGGQSHWLTLFRSFGTVASDKPPVLVFGPEELGGEQLSCTRLELPAAASGVAATFSMVECPASPWRVLELLLVNGEDGQEIWKVRRE